MLNEEFFNDVHKKAKGLKYNSMNYVCFDDCKNADVVCNDDDLVLLKDMGETPAMIYFAADDFGRVIEHLRDMPGELRLHFVPKEYVWQLAELGFVEWGEYVDFWNRDLVNAASQIDNADSPEYLGIGECEEASMVSQKCKLQSRGFEGETPEWFADWLKENKVIIVRKNTMIAGFCCVSIYGEGTTLWIRKIAIDPVCQGLGLGKILMEQAIKYGVKNGAARGFLSADILNKNAIGLYNKYGFNTEGADSELQMIRAVSF
ncbi:MAG: GNAT family N-acetyltransferase [Defluviitaleaceae bacterium]|nr:GNAT family N-acetyltransferase [Defluviitaleaceae bacterium]